MGTCTDCGERTKGRYHRCYDCFKSKQDDEAKSQKKQDQKHYASSKYPSHTDLLASWDVVKEVIIEHIFAQMGWTDTTKAGFIRSEVTTSYRAVPEHNNWDLVYFIEETPEEKLQIPKELRYIGGETIHRALLIEYKSSIKEWGKQFDAYLRQIKKRLNISEGMINRIVKNNDAEGVAMVAGIPFIVSFDPEFEDFRAAAEATGIYLIILPEELLDRS